MPRTRTIATAFATALMLVAALAAPSSAKPATPEQQQAEARLKKAKLAAELNTLKATDDQLETAVKNYDAGINVQSNDTEAAKRALAAAETGLETAESRLAATEQRMAEMRSRVSSAAVQAYVHPGGDPFLDIVGSKDLGEASRRQTLLSTVVSSDRDAIDQMRAAREDEEFEKANLAEARDLAGQRRKTAADKLTALQQARSEQTRLQSALEQRIDSYTAEVEALSREEAKLAALIRARAAPAPSGGSSNSSVSASGLVWPASGPVTSGFGVRWGRLHAGIDIGAGYGSTVKASKGGTVILAGYNGGYGNCVVIDHGGGFTTLYGHMSRLSVSDGQQVKQGQQVGLVGNTGHSTGAHLHFETRTGGNPQNPRKYL